MTFKKITEVSVPQAVASNASVLITQQNGGTETLYRTNADFLRITSLTVNEGYFTATYAGGTTVRWDYTLDGNGRITAITEHT